MSENREYRYKNLSIRHDPDGGAVVTVHSTVPYEEPLSEKIEAPYRSEVASTLAGPHNRDARLTQVAGQCPSCRKSRLVVDELGYLRCENTKCAIPNAAAQVLIDPDLRCRCGYLRTDSNDTCEWHRSRVEREHLGWVLMRAEQAASLHSDGDAVASMIKTTRELIEALRLTAEYVGLDVLRPDPGWDWYDALSKHMPEFDKWLAKMPSRGTSEVAANLNTASDLDDILDTLRYAQECASFSDKDKVHVERLRRLIHACDHRRRGLEDDVPPFMPTNPTPQPGVLGATQQYAEELRDRYMQSFGQDGVYAEKYPYTVGDFITLGPQIFTDIEGTVINWKGENYYPRPARPVGTDPPDEQVAAYVEAFKKAWHDADERGETGQRTIHGIQAVLALIDDTLTGQRIPVSAVQAGDLIAAYFAEQGTDENFDNLVDTGRYFRVEGYAYETQAGGTLYVGGGNQVRKRDGSPAEGLGEVRLLERAADDAEDDLDPLDVQTVTDELYAIRYSSQDEDVMDVPTLARALVRRNVKKVPK